VKGEFKSGDKTSNARSGLHPFSSQKWGSIPDGTYKVDKPSNTNNVPRFYLAPEQGIGNRSELQVHPKS
jgi:hypothetical protein